MKHYRQNGRLDDALDVFGDVRFHRLDMLADPATLPPGVVQVSENLRFDAQGAQVRGGLARQFPAASSVGRILGCGIYKPVGGADQLALVTEGSLWLFEATTQTLARYAYPAGETIGTADEVDVIQAGIGASGTLPDLYILRGLGNTVLRFDGSAVATAPLVPPAAFGLFYQNRLAVNDSRQSLKVSHLLDFDTFTLLDQFQIEQGGADYLVGLLAYQRDYVLIGARKKIFLAYFDPALAAATPYPAAIPNSSFLRLLTSEAGPLGKGAMLEAAGLLFFTSDTGIYAIQPQLDNSLTPLGRPLSADIQPVFSRLSAQYAGAAAIARHGHRLYFALPISEVPVAVTSVTVTDTVTVGLTLPFTLPALLSSGGLAEIETATAHDVSPGDLVQLSGVAAGGINGQWSVLAVLDETTFTIAIPVATVVVLGARAQMQKLATRNNFIAVLNLNNRDADHPVGMWESIDSLPAGYFADWLRIADWGSQRRLWVVDAINGPSLYEEGDVDDIGDIQGGITLPFTLPATLSASNFASVAVPGRLVSRAYRWEGGAAYERPVRASEARLTVAAGDAGTVTTRLRTPNRLALESTATFTAGTQTDLAVPKRLFNRALEVEMEVATTIGRPVIRALEVQVRKIGEY